jgi:hypothetical protein
MLQRVVDSVKEQTGNALQLTSLALAIALALLIAIGFLCAALVVYLLQHYGPVAACLAGAAIFFVVALIAAAVYAVRKRQMRERAEQMARAARQSMLTDPMVLATGLQLVRTIGVKRLIPILAIGGIALGLMASRSAAASDETAAE